MADKDELDKLTPVEENEQTGSPARAENSAGPEPDFSDDPELMALAAEFDAAIKRDQAGQEEAAPIEPEPAESEPAAPGQPPAPDFVLVDPPAATPPPEENAAASVPEGVPTQADDSSAERLAESSAEHAGDSSAECLEDSSAECAEEAAHPKPAGAPKMPYLGVEALAEPTVLSRVFNTLSLGALFVLVAVFVLQVLPGLQTGRLLWFSDELRQADVLAGAFNGHWLQLQLNGQLYQEAPPLYFWFLMGLHRLLGLVGFDLGTDYARLLFTGAAVSGLLLLLATYGLARSTAHLDRRGSFAAGCVLLSVLFLQFFFHYSSLDLFFAAFIIASHIFMFKALLRPRAPLCMGLAFLCAAAALMSKGALGLALPVLSAVLFCLWRGRPQRLIRGDFLLGFALALVPAIIWLGSIWATGQHDVVLQILRGQIWIKAFGDAWHKGPWWYYLAVLPALWLPWSFVTLALPWHRVFSPSAWAKLKSARNGERQGLAFVWIFFLGAFVLISFIQHKQPVYLVPLMGPLAVLTGRAVLQMSPLRGAVLQRVMALFFFLLAVTFVLLPVYYSGNIPSFFSWMEKLALPAWEVKLNGIFLLAVIMLATTCLLIGLVKARRSESTLLIALLSATLFAYPLGTMTMPSLDGVVSSKAASVEIKRYTELGYYPISFKVYSGVFSYYSEMIISEADDWAELDRMIAAHPKVLVAMSASRWAGWTRNPDFIEVMRFWMLSNEYVLLLRNSLQTGEPPVLPAPSVQPDIPAPHQLDQPAEDPAPEESLPEDSLPEEPLPEEPDRDMPPERMDEPGVDWHDAAVAASHVDADAAEETPEAAPRETPEGTPGEIPGKTPEEAPEQPAAEDSSRDAATDASEDAGDAPLPDVEPHPLPDGLPVNDAPQAEDPFAPFPSE